MRRFIMFLQQCRYMMSTDAEMLTIFSSDYFSLWDVMLTISLQGRDADYFPRDEMLFFFLGDVMLTIFPQ